MASETTAMPGTYVSPVGSATQVDYRGTRIDTVAKFVVITETPNADNGYESYNTTPLGVIRHELAARRIAEVLGGQVEQLVPKAVLRYGGKDTLCLLMEKKPGADHGELAEQDFKDFALFDSIIWNCDRNHGNYLCDKNGKVTGLIDHGFSFIDTELNMVMFTAVPYPLTESDKAALRQIKQDALVKRLLLPDEWSHMQKRCDLMLSTGKTIAFEEDYKKLIAYIPNEQFAFINDKIESGEYRTKSELIRAALQTLSATDSR